MACDSRSAFINTCFQTCSLEVSLLHKHGTKLQINVSRVVTDCTEMNVMDMTSFFDLLCCLKFQNTGFRLPRILDGVSSFKQSQ